MAVLNNSIRCCWSRGCYNHRTNTHTAANGQGHRARKSITFTISHTPRALVSLQYQDQYHSPFISHAAVVDSQANKDPSIQWYTHTHTQTCALTERDIKRHIGSIHYSATTDSFTWVVLVLLFPFIRHCYNLLFNPQARSGNELIFLHHTASQQFGNENWFYE